MLVSAPSGLRQPIYQRGQLRSIFQTFKSQATQGKLRPHSSSTLLTVIIPLASCPVGQGLSSSHFFTLKKRKKEDSVYSPLTQFWFSRLASEYVHTLPGRYRDWLLGLQGTEQSQDVLSAGCQENQGKCFHL